MQLHQFVSFLDFAPHPKSLSKGEGFDAGKRGEDALSMASPLSQGEGPGVRCEERTVILLNHYKAVSKPFLFIILLQLIALYSTAQFTAGKIVYERKTNLYKKFKGNDWVKNYIKEADRIKVDSFDLLFNDTISVFKPSETDLKEAFSWATSKNTVYQNFARNSRLTIKDIWGENLYVRDSLRTRKWKITDSKRTIHGYVCRKAIWQANDSTRIYAWYCDEIAVGTGPESFNGLPGAILGLANEDGGVIYFAKSIQFTAPEASALAPQKTKDKLYTSSELRAKLQKEFGKEVWGKAMIEDVFGVW